MPFDPGRLKDRIRFERYNDDLEVWEPFPTEPECQASISTEGTERYVIVIRYRPDLVGFKDTSPAVRIVWPASPARPTDRVWDVTDVEEIEWHQWTQIHAAGRQIASENLGSGARRTHAWPR